MNRKLWLTTIIVLVVLLLTYFVFQRPKNETFAINTTVVKGSFEILVYSTGQLESKNSDNILIPEKMKDQQTRISNLTITDMVEEGTYVDSGDYVATLDHQAVEEQLKGAMDEMELPNLYRREADALHTASDGQKFEQHSIADQIAADRYLNAKAAVKKAGSGIKISKLSSSGA